MNWYNDKDKGNNSSSSKTPKKHNSVPAVHLGNIELTPQKKQKRRTKSTGPKIELHSATAESSAAGARSYDFHPTVGFPADGYVLHDAGQYRDPHTQPTSYPTQYHGYQQHPVGYPDPSLPQFQSSNLDSLGYQGLVENYHSMPPVPVSDMDPLRQIPPEVQTSELSSSHFRAQQKGEQETQQRLSSNGDSDLIERVGSAAVEQESSAGAEQEDAVTNSEEEELVLVVKDEDEESGTEINSRIRLKLPRSNLLSRKPMLESRSYSVQLFFYSLFSISGISSLSQNQAGSKAPTTSASSPRKKSNASLLEKKSVFTIAYEDMNNKAIRANSAEVLMDE